MKIKNILYVHQDGLITGSAISLRNLLLSLDREKYRPIILLAQEGPARKLFEALDIPVETISIRGMWTCPGPKFPKPDYFRNWLALLPNLKVKNFIRNTQPDLVHINDKTMISAGLIGYKLKIPVIFHLRSSYAVSNSYSQSSLSRFLIRRIANHLIAISEDETDGFEDLPNLSIIYNSVDFTQVEIGLQRASDIRIEFKVNENEILIGTISTQINEIRGSWDFIAAAGELKKRLPDKKLRFVIVGKISNPEIETETWRRAKNAGIHENLIVTGFRSDVLSIIAALDLVILCNRHGVLGRIPFEAMSLGRPIVVTAGHSGRSKIVINEETALVVPPANTIALAEAVVRLIQFPMLREQLKQKGIQYARDNFDPQKNARRVEQIYEEVIKSSSNLHENIGKF